ncbi:sucrase-isomaltase, intestinal-like [Etheostoma spectabile]|uniref:sucrase-isomaltase, intestinal-like n=1 Tax=Etheostoma spectabile TaxID=54343 RepID=UPI0013AFC467|nr:sucrase-isomaltase, intestinal-like [Etheostoma spectabile]
MGKRRFSGLEVTLIVMFTLMSVAALALIVLFVTGEPGIIKDETTEVFVPQCPSISLAERVDCFPDAGASKLQCEQRGCCWSPLDERNVPWCFFSTNHGYIVESVERPNPYLITAQLKRMTSPSLFGADIQELSFHAEMQSSNRLRFKIYDAHRKRFEVPHEHISSLNSDPSSPIINTLEMTDNPFGLIVRRKENNKVLFDTTLAPLAFADQYLHLFNTTMAPLVFADQYLQLSAKLPSHNIYGLGEHVHRQYRHDTNWKTWPIFTRDGFPNGGFLLKAYKMKHRSHLLSFNKSPTFLQCLTPVPFIPSSFCLPTFPQETHNL